MAFKQEINKKTPIKMCPSSSEKLRKKLNNQSTELRKKRRENLFNEKRSNLIELPENGQFINIQSNSSLLINKTPINLLNFIKSNNSNLSGFNSAERFTILINKLDNFYNDLKLIYSLFKQSSKYANELIKHIYDIDNRNVELEFRKLFNLDTDLYDYVSYNQLNKINDTKFNRYQILVNDTINLIKEIVNSLNEFCFQQTFDQILIDQFVKLINFLFTQNILSKQQFVNSIFKFINLIKNRKLIKDEIQTYRNLFLIILLIRDGLDESDELNIYLNSLEFWNLLIKNTELAINLIKDQNVNDDLLQDYLFYIFNFTHYNLSAIEYGSFNEKDDIYNQNINKLIMNLKQIEDGKSNLKFETLIYFIQTINDYFDPSIDLDTTLPTEFIKKLCFLVKENLNSTNNDLIITIICLFSNITSLEWYTEMLIDFKFTLLFGNLIDKFKSFNQNTIYYILTIIKNIRSINLDHFLFLFTQTIFMDQFLNSIQYMNSDCLNETSSILEDLFNNSNEKIIQQFLKSKLIEIIPEILSSRNQNLIHIIFKILNLILLNKNLKSAQLNYFIMLLESNNLIDQIEKFSFNKNTEISKLATKLLDNYYELAEMKENYY